MQGTELRAIRKELGWTLAQLAEQLGMSETYVGQMERGQKPIERRTELAARYLREHGADLPITVTLTIGSNLLSPPDA